VELKPFNIDVITVTPASVRSNIYKVFASSLQDNNNNNKEWSLYKGFEAAMLKMAGTMGIPESTPAAVFAKKVNPLCIYNPISLLAHISKLVLDAAAAANMQKHLRSLLGERQTHTFRSIIQQQKQFHCFFCSQTKSSVSAETLLLLLLHI
jgi:hypothetical protein